jgi:hypothetical protein
MFIKVINKISLRVKIGAHLFLILVLIFFMDNQAIAQKDSTKSNLTISSTKIESQSETQQTGNAVNYAENRNEVNEFWKKYLIEEASKKMVKVDTDSIYLHYARNRKYNTILPDYYMVKIIPHQSLSTVNKIAKKDTILLNKILPANKYFSTLTINNEKDYNAFLSYSAEWDVFVPKTTFTTIEVINSILPPYIVNDKIKNTPKEYGKFINNYFSLNPEVVLYCNSAFLNMLAKQDYEKLLLLHLNTNNTVKLISLNSEKK